MKHVYCKRCSDFPLDQFLQICITSRKLYENPSVELKDF